MHTACISLATNQAHFIQLINSTKLILNQGFCFKQTHCLTGPLTLKFGSWACSRWRRGLHCCTCIILNINGMDFSSSDFGIRVARCPSIIPTSARILFLLVLLQSFVLETDFNHECLTLTCIVLISPTAKNNIDYVDSFAVKQFNGTLSPINEDVRCLMIILIDDNYLDGNKTFVITLRVSDPTVIVMNNITTVIIIDNDGQFYISS